MEPSSFPGIGTRGSESLSTVHPSSSPQSEENPFWSLAKQVIAQREALRLAHPSVTSCASIAVDNDRSVEIKDDLAASVIEVLSRVPTELCSAEAELCYRESTKLLVRLAAAAEGALGDQLQYMLDAPSIIRTVQPIMQQAVEEVLLRLAPFLVHSSSDSHKLLALTEDEMVAIVRGILAHNNEELRTKNSQSPPSKQETEEMCRKLPQEIFEKLRLEELQEFMLVVDVAGGMLNSLQMQNVQTEITVWAEQMRRAHDILKAFPRLFQETGLFWRSLNEIDVRLCSSLRDTALRVCESIESLRQHGHARFSAWDPSSTHLAFGIGMFLGTQSMLSHYGVQLAEEVIPSSERLLRRCLGVHPEEHSFPHIPLSAIPRRLTDVDQCPPAIRESLTSDGRRMLDRLIADPLVSVVILAFRTVPSALSSILEAFSKVDACIQRPEAKSSLDRIFIDVLAMSLLHDVGNLNSRASILLLRTDPLLWALECSLAGDPLSLLELRCSILAHEIEDKGSLSDEYAGVLLRQTLVKTVEFESGTAYNSSSLISMTGAFLSNQSIARELVRTYVDRTLPRAIECGINAGILFHRNTILAMSLHPESAEDALGLTLRLQELVSGALSSTEQKQSSYASISDLVFAIAQDAAFQGIPFLQVTVVVPDGDAARRLTIEQMIDTLELSSADQRPSSLEAIARHTLSLNQWWDRLEVALTSFIGYPIGTGRAIRSHFGNSERVPHMLSDSVLQILNWSCFSRENKSFPSPDNIALTLYALSFGDTPHSSGFDIRNYELFSAVMSAPAVPNWVREIGLAHMAALFMQYKNACSGQRFSVMPLKQMMSSIGRLSYEPDLFRRSFAAVMSGSLESFRKTTASELCRVPDVLEPRSPVDVMMYCIVLGIDHAEFSSSKLVIDVLRDFNARYESGGWVAPKSCWRQSGPVVLPTIRRQKETVSDSGVLRSMAQISDEIRLAMSLVNPTYGRLRSSPPPALCNDVKGLFLADLLSRERYYEKCSQLLSTEHARDRIMQLVEIVNEHLSGGLDDEVRSFTEPDTRQSIVQTLGFDVLTRYVFDEYLRHQSPSLRTDKHLTLSFVPTRGVLAEFAGHLCNTCLTRSSNLVEQNSGLVFVPFIRNSASADGTSTPSFAGGSLVVEVMIRGPLGEPERALMIRGFNPSIGLLKKVAAGSLVEAFADYLVDIAIADGISAIVVPRDETWGLALTNRPFVFHYFEQTYFDSNSPARKVVDLDSARINAIDVREVVEIRRLPL